MNANYVRVAIGLLLYYAGISVAISQSGGPEFLNCSSVPVSLCVNDPGVRLPATNQLFLGDLNQEASSCSVQVSDSLKIRSTCGSTLDYEVRLYLFGSTPALVLQPPTEIQTDEKGEADLIFDSALSPEQEIRQNGLPYTDNCLGYHRIDWIARDSCGNESICTKWIDLYDCKPPEARPIPPYRVIRCSPAGFIFLHAQDFFLSAVDDCTPRGQLLYSLSSSHYLPDSSTFICNIPNWGVEVPLDLWISDRGRDLDCNGKIDWSERNQYKWTLKVVYSDNGSIDCWEDGQYVAGTITTIKGQPLADISVNLNSTGHVFPTVITTSDGHFRVNVTGALEGEITPVKYGDCKNGVSTLDLIQIQKHLLGIQPFDNPYEAIAADANNSQSVSAIDIVELRKLILGIYSVLPFSNCWRFVPQDFIFPDLTHPWPFDESLNVQITQDIDSADFFGIKVGDVNRSARPGNTTGLQEPAYPPLAVVTDQQFYSSNQEVNIPLKLQFDGSILGFQFTLTSPELEFQEITMSGIHWFNSNYALFDDQLTLSWFDGYLIPATLDSVFVIIKARAKRAGNLKHSLTINSNITTAEFYDAAEKIYRPVLQVRDIEDQHLSIFSTTPNPWKEECSIPFYLPEDGIVNISVSTISGDKEYSNTQYFGSGYHEIKLSRADFRHQGVMICTIQEKDAVQSKLMILE